MFEISSIKVVLAQPTQPLTESLTSVFLYKKHFATEMSNCRESGFLNVQESRQLRSCQLNDKQENKCQQLPFSSRLQWITCSLVRLNFSYITKLNVSHYSNVQALSCSAPAFPSLVTYLWEHSSLSSVTVLPHTLTFELLPGLTIQAQIGSFRLLGVQQNQFYICIIQKHLFSPLILSTAPSFTI